mmetsp:Transcript_15596/g.17334  ORF Transcript_15596/g.17334 Transcript_15596/m.17334 type:complete len:178 (-) Transcript_15596:170-703(-)
MRMYQKKKDISEQDIIFIVEDREPENHDEKILFFLRKVLKSWTDDIRAIPKPKRKTQTGREQIALLINTKKDIRPLLGLMWTGQLHKEIKTPVYKIIEAMMNQQFVKANDHYYRLSVGNAPWPMGVTMVGIHERSAREKIFAYNIAHVLNDEGQRKFILALKRVITYWQKKHGKLGL